MRTHLFRPAAAGKYPAIMLFSEIFQVTGPIRRTAALLASHGFLVAVPEIFHEFEQPGAVLPYDSAGSYRLEDQDEMAPEDRFVVDVRGEDPSGVLGLPLPLLARLLDELDA